MNWNDERFEDELGAAVRILDRVETEQLCDRLIAYLRTSQHVYDSSGAKRILGKLQRKRYFDLLQRVADAFQQSGLQTPTVKRQYAQALLDQSCLSAAIPFLEQLVIETSADQKDAFECAEARGLLGRAYKQIYVDINNPASYQARRALNISLKAYHSVYLSDRVKYSWHGINTAALLHRAIEDGVDSHIEGVDDARELLNTIAAEILQLITAKWEAREASMWDSGTALEACIALMLEDKAKEVEARTWLHRYVREPYADAFELASTLRQMLEVWRLSPNSEPGASILPILQAEQLKHQGSSLLIKPTELKLGLHGEKPPKTLEKILGRDRYVSYEFMRRATNCARAVARIEHQPGQGYGTGFVLRGGDLHPNLGDKLVLLTNSHVVSEDPLVSDALRPETAIVTFQILFAEAKAEQEYAIARQLWSSPPGELDATLLLLEDYPEGIEPCPIAPRLPLADGEQRVYVIGHPAGGTLSFSIQDNILLDHEAPRLHYRAPTEGGSSGSPVFNAQWKLVGLHHAGGRNMLKLNGGSGTYEANEGLWIQSIIKEMERNPQRIE